MAAEKDRPLPKRLVLFSAVTASAETIKKELTVWSIAYDHLFMSTHLVLNEVFLL